MLCSQHWNFLQISVIGCHDALADRTRRFLKDFSQLVVDKGVYMKPEKNKKSVLTIPNALSILRILLIVPYVSLFYAGLFRRAAFFICLCGATDLLDGFLARRFHMESNLGRILDPLADKLVQAAMCLSMMSRYPIMFWVLIFFGMKELVMVIMGSHYVQRTGIVINSRWYGKASSIVQYTVTLVLILSTEISSYSSNILIWLCLMTHFMSMIMYVVFYSGALLNPDKSPGMVMRPIDWQSMAMYLLLLLSVFVRLFSSGDSFLMDILPLPGYVLLRAAALVGVVGIPAFFIGERLPRELFHPDRFPFASFAWENDGKIYEKIKIQQWKTYAPDMSKYLRRTFAKQGNLVRDPDHLRRLVQETCSAEMVHWALLLASPVFYFCVDYIGWFVLPVYVLGNLVPIIIQRYNRPRILKIIQRIEKRKCGNC